MKSLPEAMTALEELQSPETTSLNLRDIVACLRLKLWNLDKQQFVGVKGVLKHRPRGGALTPSKVFHAIQIFRSI